MAYSPPTHARVTRNPFLPDAPPTPSNSASLPEPIQNLQPPSLKEYTFDLLNKSGKPWATLSVLGDAEHSKTTPAFVEGSAVTGEVRLNLESGDSIHAVALSVCAPTIFALGKLDR
jgi:hypothetical protein